METTDAFPIEGIDFVELCAGDIGPNAGDRMVRLLCDVFGFTRIAYARDNHYSARVLQQGDIRFMVTDARQEDSETADFVRRHGDGIRNIAFRVPNARTAYKTAIERGAISVAPPMSFEDMYGRIECAHIGTYGDTIHSLIERKNYRGVFAPDFRVVSDTHDRGVGLVAIDHIVGNVERGQMNRWVKYYEDVMGFTNTIHFTDKDIKTEYTSLMSKVMQNRTGKVKFPINEPAGENESHVDEFLHAFNGPGVQHIAMETKDIVATVRTLRNRGVQFSPIPSTYYRLVRERFSDVEQVNIDTLQELNILADRDDDGYMLQIFTKPVVDRPTLFFEFIERQGSLGFGHGNFQALYEAKELERLEREQAKRCML